MNKLCKNRTKVKNEQPNCHLEFSEDENSDEDSSSSWITESSSDDIGSEMDCSIIDNDAVDTDYEKVFPDLILDGIFAHLNFKDLLVCAAVCRHWRDRTMQWPRWKHFNPGFHYNSHSVAGLPHCMENATNEFRTSYFPNVKKVTFIPVVPFFAEGVVDSSTNWSDEFKLMDITVFSNILVDSSVEKMDMSRTLKLDHYEWDFLFKDDLKMTAECHLTSVELPKKWSINTEDLRSIIARTSNFNHLSLESDKYGLTEDKYGDYDYAFVSNKITSLKLDIDNLQDEGVLNIFAIRDLPLESLTVKKSLYLIDQTIFAPRQERKIMACLGRLKFMESLVNLNLSIALTYVNVVLVLLDCPKLK